MADRVAAPENPWSAAMDEDGSPWDADSPRLDVPSRSQSNHNLAQAGEEAQTGRNREYSTNSIAFMWF
ncbi:hypothetical protein D0861_07187 [Hortaea werneckii]|uniref:Uncharacterized protein n=1 Tax=Hortaea werneckii TaxID=91943 RepID=A0A3M7F4Z6_HORWE|nr:hypothetical protein D0861_07187 [Hortaea werneckii]